MDAPQTILSQSISCPSAPHNLYLICGTFNTIFLYILAFNTQSHTLSISSRIDACGPHQYIASDSKHDRIYATTWAANPSLSSWIVHWGNNPDDSVPTLEFLNQVDIMATSSYITLTSSGIYSVGGPTGEVHSIDPSTRGFGKQLQALVYTTEPLEKADKTRKALRHGPHAIEFNSAGKAFVPHLGTNSIIMYQLDEHTGTLGWLSDTKSPRDGDGPRHVVPGPNGKYLYSVTEHTSYVDVFEIVGNNLIYRQSGSIIPPGTLFPFPFHPRSTSYTEWNDASTMSNYRGDTIRLSRRRNQTRDSSNSPPFLFATTRGASPAHKGYVAAFALTSDGLLSSRSSASDPYSTFHSGELEADVEPLHRYETPTSGGKANAIEIAPYSISSSSYWIALTDDEQGYVHVLEWSAKRGSLKELDHVQLDAGSLASHAIWLA
ncbi:hypothetical protein BS47DRAFT_1334019 [Hydnum rufescens UP504]|uniref:3-carboxy-cis,cis-mucoante lactonizing enzyme n=1 Tax=Hydnum rufescens UP504 TaxID=1448309 RepID=A0A9P6AHU7_9AGAM|nr:hypothetical protein BS47DRAFT_1334019 [Hydnum rufescens UP504]